MPAARPPSKLDCGCLVFTDPKGTAFVPRCAPHVAAPHTLGALVDRMQDKGLMPRNTCAAPAREGYTYSGNPGASAGDQVRFLLGDTNLITAYLSDGEISWLLDDAQGDALSAAIRGTEVIIGKLARNRDESVGSVSIAFSQSLGGYEKLASVLKRRQAKKATPFAGGISRTSKAIQRGDRDRVAPSFIRDLMQMPDRPETYTALGLCTSSRSATVAAGPRGIEYGGNDNLTDYGHGDVVPPTKGKP